MGFDDPETALKISALCTLGYAGQCLLAPDFCQDFYFEPSHAAAKNHASHKAVWRWFGQALLFSALRDAAAAKSGPTKGALQAAAGQWITAPVLMATQTKSGVFKMPMAIANGTLCLGLGILMKMAQKKL